MAHEAAETAALAVADEMGWTREEAIRQAHDYRDFVERMFCLTPRNAETGGTDR